MWKYTGQERPPFADNPAPGQESVWDYPRPPVLVPCASDVEVKHGATRVAGSTATLRVLETASPPTYYLPAEAVEWALLEKIQITSYCEWKGNASYWALASDPTQQPVAWQYEDPSARFAAIAGCVSFYPARIECFVDGERVQPQPGEFYGGWVTSSIAGPFKGAPGTGHW